MATPAAALETIRDKVRKVTGRYSTDMLSDDQIDKYINDFYVYNLPDTLRTFRLRVPYNFTTVPDQDTYNFPYTLYNSVEPSVYVGGYNARWFQSRTEFYALWPKLKQNIQLTTTSSFAITNIVSLGAGLDTEITAVGNNFPVGAFVTIEDVEGMIEINDLTLTVTISGDTFTVDYDSSANTPYTQGGVAGSSTFEGVIQQIPFLRAQIAAESGEDTEPTGEVQTSNVLIVMQPPDSGPPVVAQDISFLGNVGVLSGDGVNETTSYVNYIDGAFSVSYDQIPPDGSTISCQVYNYGASRPISVLFFNNQFTFRPVPDQVYPIEMVAYKTPTQLLAGNDPALKEWWMLLAYGASKLVYSDFPDPEGMTHVERLLQEQIDMMETRTVKQLGNERAATIVSTAPNPNYMGYYLPYQGGF